MNLLSDLPDANNYDVAVFAVPHKEFALINLTKWIGNKNILLFDANNVLTKKQIKEVNDNNFNYVSIGRG